jgi:hypothetical protein
MREPSTSNPALAIALGLVLAAPAFAGCMGEDGFTVSSYSEAQSMDGVTVDPRDSEDSLRLKMLQPADPQADIARGDHELAFLIFDSATDEPVTDADVSLLVEKSHADKTASVEGPTHDQHGVYKAQTSFDEPEGWELTFDVSTGDRAVTFNLHAHVGEADHEHDSPEGDEDHDHDHEL